VVRPADELGASCAARHSERTPASNSAPGSSELGITRGNARPWLGAVGTLTGRCGGLEQLAVRHEDAREWPAELVGGCRDRERDGAGA